MTFYLFNCNKKYNNLSKYKYDASIAHRNFIGNLINSRKGIAISSEEFKVLDNTIKKGVEENKSIYQIKIKKY